jgi:tetratricopeptide (TPR) repeat protein
LFKKSKLLCASGNKLGQYTNVKNKRKTGTNGNLKGFSASLCAARNLVNSGKHAEGLAALNQLAVVTRNPTRLGKILTIIGESEARLSRHSEACIAFSKATQYANQGKDYDLLLRAGHGSIRSLLRSSRSADATAIANLLIIELQKADQDVQDISNLSPAQLAAKGYVTLPSRPPRSTVVLTKIGNAYSESGLILEAKKFYRQATQLSPNGASRARQKLAAIALAEDNPVLAERFAREALLMGRFQAKTIEAWQLYLDARARQNFSPLMEQDVFAAFKQNAKGRVAAASILSIVRVLRAHDDSFWKILSFEAVANDRMDSIIKDEIEKIIQADAILRGSEQPKNIAARSLRLFLKNSTSSKEQVAHAKTYVFFTLKNGISPSINFVLNRAASRFNQDHCNSVHHAIALSAIQANRSDLARTWLNQLILKVERGSTAWSRAMWAWARMEGSLGRHAEAALLYLDISSQEAIPLRFRIHSMLSGITHLGRSGDAINLDQISQSIRGFIPSITDYKVALDAARQLSLAGENFQALRDEIATLGIRLADLQIARETSSLSKLKVCEYLARKQYWDLQDSSSVVIRWDGMSDSLKNEMRVTGGSKWYEYCSIVLLALINTGKTNQFNSLASSILDEGRSSPEGYVIVGSIYAKWLFENSDKNRANDYFIWISKELPTHVCAAESHYWLAIKYLRANNVQEALSRAQAVRSCFAGNPSLLSEWDIDAKALLILSNFNELEASKLSNNKYSTEFIKNANERVKADCKMF